MAGDSALASRAPRRRIAAALFCIVLLVPTLSGARADTAVVAPGQESLLVEILGQGHSFPGPCSFAGGGVDHEVIRGSYACPGGLVEVELREAGQAAGAAATTDKFAIFVTEGGAAPPDFIAALRAHVESRESAFEWQWVAPPEEPVFAPAPFGVPAWVTAGVYFYLALIAAVLVGLWRTRARLLSRDAIAPLLLGLLALGLRFAAHAVPADIRAVLAEYNLARLGWSAFLHLVFLVLPRSDETIWSISRCAGALSVPLLYAVMRSRFSDRLAAVAGAATLAVTPLLVRFSATDTPYILLSAAFLAAIVAYDRFTESESVGAMALALGLLTAAMQLRPDAPWLIVPAACLALARPLPSWRALLRPSIVACGLAFVTLNTVATLAAVVETGRVQGGYSDYFVVVAPILLSPWGVADMTPVSLAALVALGALVAVLYGRSGALWLLAALVANPFSFAAAESDGSVMVSQYANARYFIPAMHLGCGLAGLGVAALIRALGWLTRRALPAPALAAVVIVCLAAAPGFGLLWRMWTPQLEFEFYRSGLAQLDPACRVVTLANTRDAGFIPFDYLLPVQTLDLPAFLADPPDGCVVYYRAANCYSPSLLPPEEQADFTVHPACRAIEERYELQPIVETALPVLRYRGERYVRDPLPVGFFRVSERAAPGAAPGEAP